MGELIPSALAAVRKGGRVVCAGIHMSDVPSLPYRLLWEERQLVSVANLTRQDGMDFLRAVPGMGIAVRTNRYPLEQANTALSQSRTLRGGSRADPPISYRLEEFGGYASPFNIHCSMERNLARISTAALPTSLCHRVFSHSDSPKLPLPTTLENSISV